MKKDSIEILFNILTPLVRDPPYLVHMAKISIKKKKGSSKKFPMSVVPRVGRRKKPILCYI